MKAKTNRQDRQVRRAPSESEPQVESLERLRELEANAGTGRALSGRDLDADWQRAASPGEEAVADQGVVDETGEALGVPQAPEAEVRTSEEILRNRDRAYWDLEWKDTHDRRSS